MTDTPSLGKAHLQPRAGSPEVPINEWMDAVENSNNKTVTWNVNTKSHLTQDDLASGFFHLFTGDPSGTVEITIDGTNSEGDALHRFFVVINNTLEAIRVGVFGQSGSTATVNAGLGMALRSDGASVEEFVIASAAVASIDADKVVWDPTTYDLGDNVQEVGERLYSDLLAISTGDTGAAQGTFLVSGGQVAWQSAYTYRVSAASYFINGVAYTSSEQTITLDSSDANFDRIDVIAVDTTGTVVKVAGTAASEPSEPDVDPGSQLKLSFALVNAASTQPTLVTNTPIYSENAGEPGEWNGVTSGSGFTLNSGTSPRTGSFCIAGTAVANGAYAEFSDNSGLFDPTTAERFVFFIQSTAAWNSNRGLAVTMRSQSGAVVGGAVNIRRSGTYGFDSTQTAGYQQIAIPMEDFAIPAGTMVGRVRFTDFGGSIGFRIDDVYFQGGSGSTQPQSGLTQAQADALYAPIGASYVIVGPASGDPTLPNERRLVAGSNVTISDGGAGGDLIISADSGGGGGTPGALYPAFTAPVDGDFAWINQGAATVTVNNNSGISLKAPASGSISLRIRKKTADATPYTITAFFIKQAINSTSHSGGLLFRQSSDGKLVAFMLDGQCNLRIQTFTSPTAFDAQVTGLSLPHDDKIWLRIKDDGVNRIYYWSKTGYEDDFIQFYSEARTTFLTADEVGYWVNTSEASWICIFELLSWED